MRPLNVAYGAAAGSHNILAPWLHVKLTVKRDDPIKFAGGNTAFFGKPVHGIFRNISELGLDVLERGNYASLGFHITVIYDFKLFYRRLFHATLSSLQDKKTPNKIFIQIILDYSKIKIKIADPKAIQIT